MTIADAFNRIAVNQGGQPDTTGTIAGAIDAVCDAVAGEDVPERATIEESVELLGEYIGGGGATVEPLAVTANGTYDGGGSVAYSPVTVSVTGQAKTITRNGTYTATDGVGYTPVTVNVPAEYTPGTSYQLRVLGASSANSKYIMVRWAPSDSNIQLQYNGATLSNVSDNAPLVYLSYCNVPSGQRVRVHIASMTLVSIRAGSTSGDDVSYTTDSSGYIYFTMPSAATFITVSSS